MDLKKQEALKAFLEDRDALDVPGNALLVLHKDQEIFRHFTGSSNPDTIYRVYSMTKVVTVTAALQLLELGKFTMNDPLSMYLPEFQNMTVWDEERQAAIPVKREILMRDLFSMSAGITYEGESCETERQYRQLRLGLEAEYPDESYSTQQFIRLLPQAPLAFEPGTHWRYSLCHDVLGAVIEVLSGQTLGEYMKEHIFDPLGMKNTFFRCPQEKKGNIAEFESDRFGDEKFGLQARYESGGGGLLSTIDDYMKFAHALTRGGTSKDGVRILGRKTIDLLRTDQLNEEQKKDFNWSYLKGYSYGFGVRTLVDPAEAGIPGTVGEFGWCGVLGTWVLIDPEEELTVVYMHQRFPNLEEYVQTHLRAMIYSAL